MNWGYHPSGFATWRATSGNGAGIGMRPVRMVRSMVGAKRQARKRVRSAASAAEAGSGRRFYVDLPTVAAASPERRAVVWDSGAWETQGPTDRARFSAFGPVGSAPSLRIFCSTGVPPVFLTPKSQPRRLCYEKLLKLTADRCLVALGNRSAVRDTIRTR
jgi:hypothetical protein